KPSPSPRREIRNGKKFSSKKVFAFAASEIAAALAARQGSRNEPPSAFGSAGSAGDSTDIDLQLVRNALYASRWSSSFQPGMSAHATGTYWLPLISSGRGSRGYGIRRAEDGGFERAWRAANATRAASNKTAAITQNAAARGLPRAL